MEGGEEPSIQYPLYGHTVVRISLQHNYISPQLPTPHIRQKNYIGKKETSCDCYRMKGPSVGDSVNYNLFKGKQGP